jgi:CHAT domain-containing protein
VNDEATSHLMTAFYQALTQSDSNKAQALQQAQLKILKQRLFRHPAYWSAFLLIGNWL